MRLTGRGARPPRGNSAILPRAVRLRFVCLLAAGCLHKSHKSTERKQVNLRVSNVTAGNVASTSWGRMQARCLLTAGYLSLPCLHVQHHGKASRIRAGRRGRYYAILQIIYRPRRAASTARTLARCSFSFPPPSCCHQRPVHQSPPSFPSGFFPFRAPPPFSRALHLFPSRFN